MEKFELDFNFLGKAVDPDKSRIPLKGNEDRIVKVALDMVRFKDGGPEELWQIQSNDDGEFLVRTFDVSEEEVIKSSNWKVLLDKKEENITIAYQNVPIKRIACADYSINNIKEALLLRDTIYDRLNNDNKFVKHLINSVSTEKQAYLVEMFSNNVYKQARDIPVKIYDPEGKLTHEEKWQIPEGRDIPVRVIEPESEPAWLKPTKEILEKRKQRQLQETARKRQQQKQKELRNHQRKTAPIYESTDPIAGLLVDDVQDADSGSKAYREYFEEKLKGRDLGKMSDEEKEELFKEVDRGWKNESECMESEFLAHDQWNLAFLELHLSKNATDPFTESLYSVIPSEKPKSESEKKLAREEEFELEPEEELQFEKPEEGMKIPPSERISEILEEIREYKIELMSMRGKEDVEDRRVVIKKELIELRDELAMIAEEEYGASKPVHLEKLLHRSESLLPDAEEYIEEIPESVAFDNDFCLSKRAMSDEYEQGGENEELLEDAYYALEHYVDPGSEEAVNLSGIIYDIENGYGDPGMLRRMLEEIEEKFAEKEPEIELEEEKDFLGESKQKMMIGLKD